MPATTAEPFSIRSRARHPVKILSITPLGAEPNGSFRGASVRIQRSLLDKRTGVSTYLDNQLVTMRFEYNQNLALSEQDRILNPLAFQVTEYRVDNDLFAWRAGAG